MNFIFTVCDNAAGEVCPFWPGQSMTAHRGISIFVSLPIAGLDHLALQRRLVDIGGRSPAHAT